MQSADTSAIQRLIARARRRIRAQWAFEGAATATILASAVALVAVFLMRTEVVSIGAGVAIAAAGAALILIGALISAARPLHDEAVARRIDRASGLADRLSTAIAFSGQKIEGDDETAEMMHAAIKDGVRAVPRANVQRATPFSEPRDLRVATVFMCVSALAAGLMLPQPDRSAGLFRADPDKGRPGETFILRGKNLVSSGSTPTSFRVEIGPSDKAVQAQIIDWTRTAIEVRIPDDAPVGPTIVTAYIGAQAVGPVEFEVVDLKDERYHKENAVALDPDDRAYLESLIAQLKAAAQRDQVPELEEFAKKIEQMIKDAEDGKITKEQLLDALAKAEEAMNANAEPDQKEVDKQMAEVGKELAKEEVTKELGEALQKNDLEKAKEELEKLASKLDPEEMQKQIEQLKKELENKDLTEQQKQELQKKLEEMQKEKPLTEKQKEQLQQKLEDVSKQMEKQQQDQKQKQQQMQQQLQNEIKRLEKKKQEAKTEKEQLDAERQLQKKKDELQKLQKDQDQKDQSAQREALKRLQKDMEKAAENLDKPQKDPSKSDEQQDEEQKEREKQASRNLKDAARETGRVEQDQRKQATQKKMSSQMDDLREAMRRAKQKGNKGPQDPFNKQGKNRDFANRAKGGKGNGQSWKPGQGQKGQGQGGNQPGGQGQGQGGDSWGTGTDDNLAGDPTQKSGNTKDEDLQGTQGGKGTSRRETILAAAQKGFASVGYKNVYAEYQRIVEEVMRTEKLPASYKYYVKRYFAKIHPSTGAQAPAAPAPQDNP